MIREVVSTLLAALTSVAFALGVLYVGYSLRSDRAYAAAHPSGWVERTGRVVWTGGDYYAGHQPVRPSLVRYEDYAGVTHDVNVDMPVDTTHVGKRTRVSVNRDESIIVRDSPDDKNQSNDYPYPGSLSSYDVGGWWVLAIIGGLVLFGGSWLAYDQAGMRMGAYKGRMGTR